MRMRLDAVDMASPECEMRWLQMQGALVGAEAGCDVRAAESTRDFATAGPAPDETSRLTY